MSPCFASVTVILHMLLRRWANAVVKVPGMCCTNKIGTGKEAGSGCNTFCKATGPPVDDPIAKSLATFELPLINELKRLVVLAGVSLLPDKVEEERKNFFVAAVVPGVLRLALRPPS